MKKKLRKIVIDNEVYFWNRRHSHIQYNGEEHLVRICVEKVMIFLDTYENFGLHIYFDNSQKSTKWIVDESEGLLIKHGKEESENINLNKPSNVAMLIKYFRKNAWNPIDKQRLEVNNGLELIEKIW